MSKSTEESIAKIEEYNKNRNALNTNSDNVIIGSMDIKKWYPTMIAQPSAKEIREMVEESKIEFEGFDMDAVSQYLGEYLTNEEIIAEGMEEIVYRRKPSKKNKKKKKNVKIVNKKHLQKTRKKTTKKPQRLV